MKKNMKKIIALVTVMLLVLGSSSAMASYFEIGDTGDAVTELQQSLMEQGFVDRRPTGEYDLITEIGIETYKAANRIEEEGVGPLTLDALGLEVPASDSPLAGKTFIFLGSSVTFGSATKGVSFVEHLAEKTGCNVIKSAQSGTTLADDEDPESFLGRNSYISRMKGIEAEGPVDAFICQLSTNDASHDKVLGEISDSMNIDDFDTATTYGAIEYVIAYAKETWDCPVLFFTNTRYDNEIYAEMVEKLQEIAEKWNITIIDLWNNDEVNDTIQSNFEYYMKDEIHPYAPGYIEVWTPVFENYLIDELN